MPNLLEKHIAGLACAFFLATAASLLAQRPVEIADVDLPDAPFQQQTPSSSPQPSQNPQSPSEQEKQKSDAQKQFEIEKHQHVLVVVPNFNTVYGATAPPLTGKQKFELAFKSATNPFQFATTAVVAGFGQAQDSYPEYGQGMEGYAKRFGAGYADSFDGAILGNALFPVLLKQDPRYYRLGTGSFKARFFYSVATAVRCRGDNGKWQPNYSNLLGNIAAGGISNLYYPASDRGVGLSFERGFVVTAEGAFGGLFLEFIPDIERRFLHRTAQKQQP